MRPTGLFNPKNATESSGGFKEGIVVIDAACFKVHQPRAGESDTEPRNSYLALAWQCTRLDEDTKSPLTDEEGNVITEEIVFSAGGKSLTHAHPGRADSVEDDNIEDVGVMVNAEGPTVYISNPNWHPDKKSALIHLQDSLCTAGIKPEVLDRTWAPDYVGAVVSIKNKPSGQTIDRYNPKSGKMEAQTFSYKIVDRIDRGMCLGPAPKKGGKKATGASSANGKEVDAASVETSLAPLLQKLGEEKTGTSMTKKALAASVNRMLGEGGTPPALVMPIMNLVRNDAWLTANGEKYDFVFTPADNQVSFL